MNEPVEELAGLYVLDQLDHSERSAFEARLVREPDLAALVRDLEAGLARGVRALPPREPPADTLDQIEARIDALHAKAPGRAEKSAPVFRWTVFARWGLAASIAISLSVLAVQSLRVSTARPVIVFVGLDANRNTFAELPLRETASDPDARFVQLASLAENFWEKPGNQPVKQNSGSGGNRGYALFDPGSRQGFIGIEQLPIVAGNQRYHLWMVDSATARVRELGILPLAGTNRGLYSFTLDSSGGPQSDRPIFFVTVEESSVGTEPAEPRGKVVLGDQHI